ncbi:hypothetical protein ACCO45_003716 [Purpureocillium lilacinum]|uniref:Uncharacterized protein n=1 Tax=Purpureocillium lilacinum TaxID=33203 RepID=A0ACC4E1U6_PURLI
MPLGVAKGSEALLSLPLAKRPSEQCCCLHLTRREFQSASSQPSQRTQQRRQPGWPDSAARSPAVCPLTRDTPPTGIAIHAPSREAREQGASPDRGGLQAAASAGLRRPPTGSTESGF